MRLRHRVPRCAILTMQQVGPTFKACEEGAGFRTWLTRGVLVWIHQLHQRSRTVAAHLIRTIGLGLDGIPQFRRRSQGMMRMPLGRVTRGREEILSLMRGGVTLRPSLQ